MISSVAKSCEHSLNTLRYADRVKQFGAHKPEIKSDECDADMSVSSDDLDILNKM